MKIAMKRMLKESNLARWWDLPAALLLLAAIITATLRLSATNWTEHLNLVRTVAVLGVIAGLALGQSMFPRGVVRFFALAYGLFVVPWRLGLILGEGITWSERVTILNSRLAITINHLLNQQPVPDNMFFLSLMASLFWLLGIYSGYTLTRHANAWRAIIPPGMAIVLIHAYDSFFPVRTWFLAGYLFFSLLLLARLNFLNKVREWKNQRTFVPPYMGLDFIRTALVATAILVLFSWTAPALATAITPAEQVWQKATRPWVSIRERLSNAFSALQSSIGFVTDFYGDTLALGRGTPLSDAIVMTVQAPAQAAPGVRYYWRARTYNYYDGFWTNSTLSSQNLSPSRFDLNLPEYDGRSLATFMITTFQPIQNLYTPPQPVWVSRPIEAHYIQNSDETIDLLYLQAEPYIAAGEVYEVEASLSSASVAQLRAAGTDYPEWVKDRYLQIPDSITPRTLQLARQIAADFDNPYDIAQAITFYLRNTIEYADTIPAAPVDREPLDWVLFDLRQGFCNYYASAQVIMLRSLGIPARMAVGYAQGQRLTSDDFDVAPPQIPGQPFIPQEDLGFEEDLYTVRHKDAHAWPEVFFPGLGWVEFEPTASQAPIFRPPGDIAFDEGLLQDPERQEEEELQRLFGDRFDELSPEDQAGAFDSAFGSQINIPLTFWLLAISLLAILGGLFARRIRKNRGSPPLPVQLETGLRRVGLQPPSFLRSWARFASLPAVTRAYLELNRALSRLGSPPAPTDTPAERAARLHQLLPTAADPIHNLVAEYHCATYGFLVPDSQIAQQAGNEIKKSSYLAIINRILARIQEPVNRKRPPYQISP